MRRKAIVYLVAGALVLLSAGVPVHANEAVPEFVGKDAPRFEGVDLDGKPVTLASLRKERGVLLINFWGLRCGACVQEIPHLNAMSRKYSDQGLNIVGVNVDGLPGAKVKSQMETMGLKIDYPWIPDPDFKVIDAFKMAGAPLNVIIDAAGKVVYYREGFEEGDEAKLEGEIGKALPGPAARERRKE